MAESILHQGISQGHLDRLNGEIVKPIVWLTTDASHIGHGLLLGNENVTPSEAIYMERVQGSRPKNLITYNKTLVRIKLRLQKSDRNLQSYVQYCAKNESRDFARKIGLSAYYSVNELTALEIETLYKKTNTKEGTWWLYKGVISPSSFENVSFNHQGVFKDYSFDKDGRDEFKKAGFLSPSQECLDELESLVPPVHMFDKVKAFCFCNDPAVKRHLHIRGGGTHITLSLDEISLTYGSAPENLALIIKWAEHHRDELISCWEEAVSVYYQYYPDKRLK